MSDVPWQQSVGFSERMAVVDQIAASLESADAQLLRPEAMLRAQQEESRCMAAAATKEDYIRLWKARLLSLQQAAARPQSEDDSDSLTKFPADEPTQTIGPYKTAVPFESGIFSTIFKAMPTMTTVGSKRSLVALKVTVTSMSQPPHNAKREARLLALAADHDNIISVLETFTLPPSTFVMVLPFLPRTLASLLSERLITPLRLPSIIHGILTGVAHLHSLGILHRDIKPSNILFSSPTSGPKIADLGIAWHADDPDCEPADDKITDVGTTSYRAPELLFGYRSYGTGVDMWALGCVIAECLHPEHEAFFDAGDLGSELQLVASIFQKLGTPDTHSWPESRELPDFGKIMFHQRPKQEWEQLLPCASTDARDLVGSLLVYQGSDRLSAKDALDHRFFDGARAD
ncbi:kinase-like domain-containing protein [Tricharina praecox]|uniref:kinase-like domain-containing protein n=1 Tax=Tricharina praecox TaxID=43433 RepID=UPI00221E95F2|nr:kinase-like domain-containing protein [Tricharina praecox]KAI5848923.1 kinase-like domain-containing protein [Tricharina praecox]